jgi:hypothetical protein
MLTDKGLGMIYLKNPKSDRRPTPSDVIVLTVRTVDEPDIVVSGAILPVSRIPSFPVRFLLNEKNAIAPLQSSMQKLSSSSLSPQENWKYVLVNNDLLVQAMVCDRKAVMEIRSASSDNLEGTTNPITRRDPLLSHQISSSPYESKPLSATGLAKLIRYPEQPGTSSGSIIIRAPVALPLA